AGWRGFISPLDTVTLGQLGTQIELHVVNSASSGDNRNAYFWREDSANWYAFTSSTVSIHDQAINLYVFNPDSTPIRLCGLYDTGSVDFGTLSFTAGNSQKEGWHFIGNPFPHPIRWSTGNYPNGTNGNYAIWSNADGNYRPWNGSVGSAGDVIPAFQGFWVKVDQALTQGFQLSPKQWDSAQINHFGKKDKSEGLKLQISSLQNQQRDELYLYPLSEGNTIPPIPKRSGLASAPELALRQGLLMYSGLPDTAFGPIPLYLRIPEQGKYLWSCDGPSCEDWVLVDLLHQKDYTLSDSPFIIEMDEQKGKEVQYVLQRVPTKVPQLSVTKESIGYYPGGFLLPHGTKNLSLYALDGKLIVREALPPVKWTPPACAAGWYLLTFQKDSNTIHQLIFIP
ncbi:MAG: hypothetical protein LPK45_03335, partial [Bacteroidota bacterium]|nr:hypothetical protein [Bacteroidota bacterium]MDX5430082.1 hypothetical protein [Bacteroidota bacterium]MDX5468846.1 hypothetical protein [Bacteroidota bacterium]